MSNDIDIMFHHYGYGADLAGESFAELEAVFTAAGYDESHAERAAEKFYGAQLPPRMKRSGR